MITATQGLKQTIQQIGKLEGWLDVVADQMDPVELKKLRKLLEEHREDIENTIKEAS